MMSLNELDYKLVNHIIYVTMNDTLKIKFRDISTNTEITHYSGKKSYTWLSGPNMKYWST